MFDKYILFSNFPCVCSSFVSLVEVLCLFLCTLDCRGTMRQECYVGIYFWTFLNFTFGFVCIWKISGMLISVFDMFFYSICVWGLQQGCGMRVMWTKPSLLLQMLVIRYCSPQPTNQWGWWWWGWVWWRCWCDQKVIKEDYFRTLLMRALSLGELW